MYILSTTCLFVIEYSGESEKSSFYSNGLRNAHIM